MVVRWKGSLPGGQLSLTSLCLAVLSICPALADRQLLARDLPDLPQASCRNTVGGRWYVTDDQGRVCQRTAFDSASGCCSEASERHLCHTCNGDDQCCTSFEHCVSCCMAPRNRADERRRTAPRGLNKPETGLWRSAFDYCRGTCRTTSRSTAHENSFILDRRYCFSQLGRPKERLPPATPLPTTVSAATGGVGQSCDDACADRQMACASQHFAALNDCNSLRTHFLCEAGCSPSQDAAFPGYVVYAAPKSHWPALCSSLDLQDGGADSSQFNCSSAGEHVQRLCPCETAPAAAAGIMKQRGQRRGGGMSRRQVADDETVDSGSEAAVKGAAQE